MDSSTSRELDHEKARDRHKHHSKPETVPGKNGDHQMGDTQSIHARSEEPSLLRKTTGQAMHQLSNLVNENIVVARYGTMATVSLLVAYGFYRTPLFFRYKTVAEIPAELFTNRRTLHGRIVHINTTGMSECLKKRIPSQTLTFCDSPSPKSVLCLFGFLVLEQRSHSLTPRYQLLA